MSITSNEKIVSSGRKGCSSRSSNKDSIENLEEFVNSVSLKMDTDAKRIHLCLY